MRTENHRIQNLPDEFKIYFWDVVWEDLTENIERYQSFVVSRLVDKGDCEVIKWLKGLYSEHEIARIVAHSRMVSKKTHLFWERYLTHV